MVSFAWIAFAFASAADSGPWGRRGSWRSFSPRPPSHHFGVQREHDQRQAFEDLRGFLQCLGGEIRQAHHRLADRRRAKLVSGASLEPVYRFNAFSARKQPAGCGFQGLPCG